LVISELATPAPPFKGGFDYIEAPLEKIPQLIEHYLSTPKGRKKASQIIDRGFKTLTTQCMLTEYLKKLLFQLYKPF